MLEGLVPKNIAALNIKTSKVPGGIGYQGTDSPIYPGDGETPFRSSEIIPFSITCTTITNWQFASFVKATNYITEAERFGWSYVYREAVLDKDLIDQSVLGLSWWCKIDGASWRTPKGPSRTLQLYKNHPVVHVSYNDALAFANWIGGDLPTEAEWEHAARGGQKDVRYPWGNHELNQKSPQCHVGQIMLKDVSVTKIGPVEEESFAPNGYGIFSMVGNVWEWTRDTADEKADNVEGANPRKILKGGSYMCHHHSFFRYRIAARISNTIDTSTGHTGFRVVFKTTNF